MLTYDENGGYPHPDHVMTHQVSVAAFEAAADPDAYPIPLEPLEDVLLRVISRRKVRGLARAMPAAALIFVLAWFIKEVPLRGRVARPTRPPASRPSSCHNPGDSS